MRYIACGFLAMLSGPALCFECPDYDASKDSIGAHIEMASDIFLGRVISGRLDEARSDGKEISLTVRVNHTFKGDLQGLVSLTTGQEPYPAANELGANYIFFLYGTREVDLCGYLLPVLVTTDSFADLIDLSEYWSESPSTRISEALAQLLIHFSE